MGITHYNAPDGEFHRKPSVFRDEIREGSKYPPEAGRYHLYVSWACPWGNSLVLSVDLILAHRTLIVRQLKRLQDIISVTYVHYTMSEIGWKFAEGDECPGAEPDPLYHATYMCDIYLRADKDYNGRYTVPVLWDKKTETIVNNESRYCNSIQRTDPSEIIRIFNTAFDSLLPEDKRFTFYPEKFAKQIDEINEWVYDSVNNG